MEETGFLIFLRDNWELMVAILAMIASYLPKPYNGIIQIIIQIGNAIFVSKKKRRELKLKNRK